MKTDRSPALFQKDFTIMIVGQIASLFGNAVLRFSLSLYVLDATGSAALFGTILAVSMIPMVVCSPIGGVLADRVSRKGIMVVLDYTTAGLLALFALLLSAGGMAAVAILMVLLSAIQSFYQPSVQSSIPLLVPNEKLEQGNGVVMQVNALSNLLGPIIGGFLYGFFGLIPILLAGICCFVFSATMELFLHIPFVRQPRTGGALQTVKNDLGGALRFLLKENPGMLKLLLLIAAINLFLSAMFMVGLPYLVKIFLGLSSQLYGFVEGAMAVGMILGGMLAGVVAKRVSLQTSSGLLYGAAACTLPIALSVITPGAPLISYAVILISVILCLGCTTLFSVIAQSFAQKVTPRAMLGKVMALVTMFSTCAFPLGQAMYGSLFGASGSSVFLVVVFAGVCGLVISLLTSRVLRRIRSLETVES